MTDHEHQLSAFIVSQSNLNLFQGADFGTSYWAELAFRWITGDAVMESMAKGTRVWGFQTPGGELVGFASLGTSRRRWKPPDGPYTNIAIIPQIAIQRRFYGVPPEKELRYSNQIMSFVLHEAQQANQQTVMLLVHPDNTGAIAFYRRWNFVTYDTPGRDGYQIMAIELS